MEDTHSVQELQRFKEDCIFFQAERSKLKKTNPDTFVGIYKKKVVEIGTSVDQVAKELEKKGIDPASAVIEFVPKKEIALIL